MAIIRRRRHANHCLSTSGPRSLRRYLVIAYSSPSLSEQTTDPGPRQSLSTSPTIASPTFLFQRRCPVTVAVHSVGGVQSLLPSYSLLSQTLRLDDKFHSLQGGYDRALPTYHQNALLHLVNPRYQVNLDSHARNHGTQKLTFAVRPFRPSPCSPTSNAHPRSMEPGILLKAKYC